MSLSQKLRPKQAVTLVELSAVIVIIGILAALALPRFNKAFEATRAKQATASLRQIRTAERIYRMEEQTTYFYSSGSGGIPEIQQINKFLHLYLDVRLERNWNYSISDRTPMTPGNTFLATATRRRGIYSGDTITIDETGRIQPGIPPWPLPLPPGP